MPFVAVMTIALILFSYWQISQRKPFVRVSFDLATDPDQRQFAENKDDVIKLTMQPDTQADILYRVRNTGQTPLHNVALYFEQISEGVSLSFFSNNPYPEPFALEYGTIEPLSNDGANYGAILKAFHHEGSYVIQCQITSEGVSYPFDLIITVSP